MHCTRGALDQGGAFHDSICHLVSDNGPQTLDSNGFQTAHHRQFDLSIVLDLEESKVLVQDNNGEMVHYLADQLKAKVNQVTRAQLRTLHEDDLEELPIPPQIPLNPLRREMMTETQDQFQQRIRETLQGNVIHSIEMPEGQEGKFPPYLNKLWLHVLKKHFPHCLGKNFCYKHCWLSVHWPIPKFKEDVQSRLLKLAGLALGILCICVIVDCVWLLPHVHQAERAAANAQLQQVVSDASHFLALKELLS